MPWPRHHRAYRRTRTIVTRSGGGHGRNSIFAYRENTPCVRRRFLFRGPAITGSVSPAPPSSHTRGRRSFIVALSAGTPRPARRGVTHDGRAKALPARRRCRRAPPPVGSARQSTTVAPASFRPVAAAAAVDPSVAPADDSQPRAVRVRRRVGTPCPPTRAICSRVRAVVVRDSALQPAVVPLSVSRYYAGRTGLSPP